MLKPNVLHIIGSFEQGGSERQAVQLVRLLHESGRCRVRVATLEEGGVLRDEVVRLNLGDIPVYPLTSFYDRNAARQLGRCSAYLREQRIDVVQTHDFYTNVFGMIAATRARVSVRIASKRETGGMRTRAQSLVERGAYRLAHAIVANAEAVRQKLVMDGVRAEKIVTIYNGLDTSRVTLPQGASRVDVLESFALPREENRRFVTIVANLRHEVKDHPTFLRAARRVREQVPEAAFVLAGEGELTGAMKALAVELGIERDVFFTGRCERLAELLSISDVCVLSSTAEGFSNSILEYMAAARPVVVTDVGGAREAVTEGETGYLVRPGDDLTMAARIASLLLEPERAREMGERGRAIVEQKFSCEAQLESTLNLYQRLLARTHAGRQVHAVEAVAGEGAQRTGR